MATQTSSDQETGAAISSHMEAQIRVTEGLLIHIQAIGGVSTDPQIQIEASKWELRLERELEELRRKKAPVQV
ncbi:MAG: hypothetical protein V7609_2133 [Verrucomicrobiota bacterium]